MNVGGITVGTRFPAYATSMGRVLLAGLPQAKFEAYLSTAELTPITPRTVASVPDLRPPSSMSVRKGGAFWTRSWRSG